MMVWMIEVLSSTVNSIPPPPPVSWEPLEFPSYSSKVCKGLGTSKKSRQDAVVRSLGSSENPRTGSFSYIGSESIRRVEAGDRLLKPDHICHLHKVQDGDSNLVFECPQEG